MPEFYVYVYRDPSRSNEAIYVGKGRGRRAYDHLARKDKHPFTQRLQLMKRNSIEPDIEILCCNNEGVAFAAEALSIKVFGRKDLGTGTLLNLTDGGEGTSGRFTSVETRQKMSDAKKGKPLKTETKQKLSNINKGKSPSVETLQKRSASLKGKISPMKGKVHSAETRQKMSDAQKGIPKPKAVVICPHCGKEGKSGSMHRWHFDNCKYHNDKT
jgi:hypothetical protein